MLHKLQKQVFKIAGPVLAPFLNHLFIVRMQLHQVLSNTFTECSSELTELAIQTLSCVWQILIYSMSLHILSKLLKSSILFGLFKFQNHKKTFNIAKN